MSYMTFDAKRFDAVEHCGEGLDIGEDVLSVNIELLDLTGSMDVLGNRDTRLGQGDSRRSDLYLRVFVKAAGVEKSCSSKVSQYIPSAQLRRCLICT